jgi:diguanylate cyclase (GGDEF)-like protein
VFSARSPISASDRLAGGIAGSLFLAGALITTLIALLPHPDTLDERGFWILTGAEVAFGILLLFWSQIGHLGQAVLSPLTIVGALAAITAGILLNGERDGGPAVLNEFFYVWPALYAGYFYRRRYVVLVLVAITASYLWVSHQLGLPTSTSAPRVLITLAIVVGSALVAHVLRIYVDALATRLGAMARTDELTVLLNRRGFDERLNRLLSADRRADGRPVALLLGDVDHFKQLNDRYGHSAGDAVLSSVGRTLRDAAREGDVVARIGGEEFAILTTATTPAEAVAVAERIRIAFSRLRDPGGEPLTISFGVASTTEIPSPDPDKLLRAADRALYAAKEAGRNRVMAYAELEATGAY